ncbi:MAG: ANTAR domain-containing protein [Mycobacteriales bacterium]
MPPHAIPGLDRERSPECSHPPLVAQACGLLMARRSLSTEDAFTEVVRRSLTSNTRLRDVAAALVADAQPDRSGARRP